MNLATVQNTMLKRASGTDEVVSNILWQSIPGVRLIGAPSNLVGGIAGMVSSPATDAQEGKMDDTRALSWLPGVSAYRLQRRMKHHTQNSEGDSPHYWSQQFGVLTAPAVATGAGALLGGLIGGASNGFKNDTGAIAGAGIGAIGGLGISGLVMLGAAVKAAIDRRRTKEEQKAYSDSPTTTEWLVPGAATYNAWKTIGRSIGDSEEREAKQDAAAAKAEKAVATA